MNEGPASCVELVVAHADDDSVEDTATIRVRDSCLCTYQFTVDGFIDEYFPGPEGKDEPVGGMVDEERGLFSTGIGREEKGLQLSAEKLSKSMLEGGTPSFRGMMGYAQGQAEIEAASQKATIRVDWGGKRDSRAKVTAWGPAKACRNCVEKDRFTPTYFHLTMCVPFTRFEEDGSYVVNKCDEEPQVIQDVPMNPEQARQNVPGSGRVD